MAAFIKITDFGRAAAGGALGGVIGAFDPSLGLTLAKGQVIPLLGGGEVVAYGQCDVSVTAVWGYLSLFFKPNENAILNGHRSYWNSPVTAASVSAAGPPNKRGNRTWGIIFDVPNLCDEANATNKGIAAATVVVWQPAIANAVPPLPMEPIGTPNDKVSFSVQFCDYEAPGVIPKGAVDAAVQGLPYYYGF